MIDCKTRPFADRWVGLRHDCQSASTVPIRAADSCSVSFRKETGRLRFHVSNLLSAWPRWLQVRDLDGANEGLQLLDYGWCCFYVKCG